MSAKAMSHTVANKKPKSRGERWSDEKKAEVTSRLILGEWPARISAETGVPVRTIHDWAKDLGTIDALRQGRISDLVYNYLTESLETLAAQSRIVREPDYVKAQAANDLAVLHGVVADKILGILAAVERAEAKRDLDRVGTEAGSA